ncbi:hypothetical protein D3C84_357130 [compost metagenome]
MGRRIGKVGPYRRGRKLIGSKIEAAGTIQDVGAGVPDNGVVDSVTRSVDAAGTGQDQTFYVGPEGVTEVGLNGVMTLSRQLDDPVLCINHKGVVAQATIERIGAGCTIEHVIACQPIDDVVAGRSVQGVVCAGAAHVVVAGGAAGDAESVIAGHACITEGLFQVEDG